MFIFRNHPITLERIQTRGKRGKLLRADYVLSYKGIKLAIIEAKSDELEVGEGVTQAKQYAHIWSNALTRRTLLEKLDEAGFGKVTSADKMVHCKELIWIIQISFFL